MRNRTCIASQRTCVETIRDLVQNTRGFLTHVFLEKYASSSQQKNFDENGGICFDPRFFLEILLQAKKTIFVYKTISLTGSMTPHGIP